MARLLTARFETARLLTARLETARLETDRFEITWEASGAELAALAFLVVLRVLIRLFFSIDMAGKLLRIFSVSRRRCTLVQVTGQSCRLPDESSPHTQNKGLSAGALPVTVGWPGEKFPEWLKINRSWVKN